MGTTGGDREKLYKTVADSKVYAVISPQMGKQVYTFCSFFFLFNSMTDCSLTGGIPV